MDRMSRSSPEPRACSRTERALENTGPAAALAAAERMRLAATALGRITGRVYTDDLQAQTRAYTWAILGGLLLLSGLLFLLVRTFVRRMTRPLAALVHGLQHSDLTREIPIESQDEIGEAARAFNGYNAGLRAMIRDVSCFADRVASGSTELAASANEMERAVAEIANVSETRHPAFSSFIFPIHNLLIF